MNTHLLSNNWSSDCPDFKRPFMDLQIPEFFLTLSPHLNIASICFFPDDIDECTQTTPPLKCRATGQQCTNYPGTYRCSCMNPGQALNQDESACVGMNQRIILHYVIVFSGR